MSICASVLREDQLMEMHQQIAIILCKLETIFPSWFLECYGTSFGAFSTRSLPRWSNSLPMDVPFKRFFKWLKQKAKNKSKLESSVAIVYLIYEIQTFGSYYFDATIPSMNSTIARNEVSYQYGPPTTFTVFQMKCTLFGQCRKCYLTQVEYDVVHLHILLNCNEV